MDCFLVEEDKDTPESIAKHLKCNYPAAIKEVGLLDTVGNFTEKGLQFQMNIYTTIQEDGNPFGFYDLLGEELGYLKNGEPTEKGRPTQELVQRNFRIFSSRYVGRSI